MPSPACARWCCRRYPAGHSRRSTIRFADRSMSSSTSRRLHRQRPASHRGLRDPTGRPPACSLRRLVDRVAVDRLTAADDADDHGVAGRAVALTAASATPGRRARCRVRRATLVLSMRSRPTGRGGQSAPDYASLLDAIARQVRSGSSLTSAVIDEIDASLAARPWLSIDWPSGGSLPHALGAADRHEADLAFTVQALSATAHLGGPVAATLDEAAAVLRERAAGRAERRAHGAQARLSARVLTIVPLVSPRGAPSRANARATSTSRTVAGAICALCGLALNLVGWRWMKRIIGADMMPAVAAGGRSLVVLLAWRHGPKAMSEPKSRRRPVRQWPWLVLRHRLRFSPPFSAVAADHRRWTGGSEGQVFDAVRHALARWRARLSRCSRSAGALDPRRLPAGAGHCRDRSVPAEPLRPAFIDVGEAMKRGDRFADALDNCETRLGPIAQPLVDSLSAADRYGLPLAPVLERLSLEARQQRRRDTEADARELPVRLAMPLVLCTLPSFVLVGHRPVAPRSPVVAAHVSDRTHQRQNGAQS